jgi:hypothetical protein
MQQKAQTWKKIERKSRKNTLKGKKMNFFFRVNRKQKIKKINTIF